LFNYVTATLFNYITAILSRSSDFKDGAEQMLAFAIKVSYKIFLPCCYGYPLLFDIFTPKRLHGDAT